jgi:hypothetical protein
VTLRRLAAEAAVAAREATPPVPTTSLKVATRDSDVAAAAVDSDR